MYISYARLAELAQHKKAIAQAVMYYQQGLAISERLVKVFLIIHSLKRSSEHLNIEYLHYQILPPELMWRL